MRYGFYAGDTDKTIYVRLRDSTTGLAKTGLAYNSAGAVCSYTLPLAARAAITLATQTVTGAHSDGGFVEIDATNCKGLYRLDLPDAAIASGAFSVISIEFDGIIEESVLIELDTQKANVTQLGSDAQSATDLKDFADAGYDPSTNKVQGVVLVDTTTTNSDMRGTDSAFLAASAPTNFSDLAITATTGLVSVSDKTGFSLASGGLDAITAWTVDITGSLSGAVGSVTGAVGSVTGNVGGNVTGSVGSISGVTFPTNFSSLAIDASGHVILQGSLLGTVSSGTIGSVTTDITGYTDDAFADHILQVLTGEAAKQSVPISAYNGTSGVFTLAEGLADAPGVGDTVLISPNHVHTIAQVAGGVWSEAMGSYTTGGTAGDYVRNSLNSAGVRTALGLSSANLDTQLDALPTAIETADATLSRAVSNVEATADKHSLALLVAIATNSSATGTTLTASKPSDDTAWFTYTLTVDAAADPVTGVE